jgi:hypothetical protein
MRSQNGTGSINSALTASSSITKYIANSGPDARQRHSNAWLLWLDTVKNHTDYAA